VQRDLAAIRPRSRRAAAIGAVLAATVAAAAAVPADAEPPARGPKAALAVLPFQPASAGVAAREPDLVYLQDALIRTFVQTGKFDVLERAKVQAVIDEHEFSTAAVGDPANAAQLGKLTGAQYVVVGNVHELGLSVGQERVPYVDEYKCTDSARVRLELRVVQTTTGRIVAAHSGTGSDAGSRVQPGRCGPPSQRRLATAIGPLAEEVSAKVIDAIYPLRVVRSSGGTVTLNRGEGAGFAVGARLACFSEGEAIVDPDTGDVLGHDETPLGEITVTEIRPTLSRATTPDGVTIPEAAVCRVVSRTAPRRPPARRAEPKVNW